MIKEIVAYILLFFGVLVAITGIIFYLRMYKAMIGNSMRNGQEDKEDKTSVD